MLEMMLLPKKTCQVGGNGIDEISHLFHPLIPPNQIAVLCESLEIKRTQAPCKAGVDHIFLVVRQYDASARTYQVGKKTEFALTEGEFPFLLLF